ncbi:transposase [Bradyrhizobium manausense]|uniref:transposase n=1 Tax=Bradyrhizobium manausense TaxID=989370 RepID=UPI003D31B4F0
MEIHRSFAQVAILEDGRIIRQLTIPGVSSVVAASALAFFGDIARCSYFGLTPRVRQSGEHPARHGRISKQGSRDALPVRCWLRRRGQPRRRRLRCEHSSTARRKSTGPGSQASRRRASSQS